VRNNYLRPKSKPFFSSNFAAMKKFFFDDPKRTQATIAWLLFLFTSLVYALTAEPTGGFWDTGEWIATATGLQVGHPPGAPLYVLIARVFAVFSFGNGDIASFMVIMVSVLAAACTVMYLFKTICLLLETLYEKKPFTNTHYKYPVIWSAAAIGALSLAFSDSFWHSATEAEVYSLSALFTAIIFWSIIIWYRNRSDRRYLLLIALLLGMSVSIHLLNLLVIPAIVMVYGFRSYPNNAKNIFFIALAALLLPAVIMYVLIPLIINTAAFSDVFFVNQLGLPVGSGIFAGFLVLYALVAIVILWSLRRNRKNLCIVATMILLFITGYSSYALIVIRSSAGTPINEANPSHAFGIKDYIEREQYAEYPLIKGHSFNSSTDKRIPFVEAGKHRQPIDNKYQITGTKMKPNYVKRDLRYFPRMWSSQIKHIEAYKLWSGCSGENIPDMAENIRFFTRYQLGHMYFRYFMWNFAGRQNDIQGHGGPLRGNWISGIGFLDRLRLGNAVDASGTYAGNHARNPYFLLPLLLGIAGLWYHFKHHRNMFWVVATLFFFTGIAIVLYLNQHPYQIRERDYIFLASFYAFAIWMGIGVFALFSWVEKLSRNKLVIVGIIAIAGLAVPVHMFARNLNDHNKSNNRTAYELAYNYLSSCAPNAILFTRGDNDTYPLWYLQEVKNYRSDVRVINLSYLNFDWYINQCRKKQHKSDPVPMSLNPLSYTAGNREYMHVYDHVFGVVDKIYEAHKPVFDTAMTAIFSEWVSLIESSDFPAQHPQEYSDMLKDFMFMAPHGKNPQFKAFRTITENLCKPESLKKHNINAAQATRLLQLIDNMLKRQISLAVPAGDAIAFAFSDNSSDRVKHNVTGDLLNYFPGNKLLLDIDKQQLLNTATVSEDNLAWVPDKMIWNLPKSVMTKSDLIVLDIIASNNWKRPIYFSISAGSENYLGLDKYFSLEGMAFRLLPIVNELSEQSMGYIDAELLYRNVRGFSLDSYGPGNNYCDDNMRSLAANYRNVFSHCARALYFEGKIKESEEVLDKCLALIPNEKVAYEFYTAGIVHGYYRINRKKKARETAQTLAANCIADLNYMLSFDEIYQPALDFDERQCLTVLQYLYRMAREYNHKEYLAEIEIQYGKMLTAYEKTRNISFEE